MVERSMRKTFASAIGGVVLASTLLASGSVLAQNTASAGATPANEQGTITPVSQPTPEANASTTAAEATPVPAAYLQGNSALPAPEIEAWLANAGPTLDAYSPADIVNYIARLAGSDNRIIPSVVKLAESNATPLRINQIARGLARARNAASDVAVDYATYIDEQVAGSSSQRLIELYQSALQEATAALSAPATGTVGPGPNGGALTGTTDIAGGNGSGTTGAFSNGPFSTLLTASYSGGTTTTILNSDGSPSN